MASTSEVGHAKNIANFQDLITFCDGYGTTYNPSKNSLKVPQLNTLLANAQGNLAIVVTKNTEFNNVVNNRINAFKDLKSLSTRLTNAFQTTDATKEMIDDAKGFNRKMQGKRASQGVIILDPNTPAPNTISSSQQSYDQLIQHFSGLISVLQSESSYAPNEAELTISALQTKLADLTLRNQNVAISYTSISNARIDRNNALYNPTNGLVETASEVKKYIKSVFGATSPQFAQVKGIQFKIIKS
jgi:hypothetical protein